MGMSPYATLCFGVDLGEDDPFVARDEDGERIDTDVEPPDELGEYLADRAGFENPWESALDGGKGDYAAFQAWEAEHPEWTDAHSAYRAKIAELEAAAPIEIVTYGGDSYTLYALAIKGYTHSDLDDLGHGAIVAPGPAERIQAAAWCAGRGLPGTADAKWLLLASYG